MVQKIEFRGSQDHIHPWLSPIDLSTNHYEAPEKRHGDTGKWFLQDPKFIRWKEAPSSSFLWRNGILGCGKTALSSTVIENLGESTPSNIVLYCYFSFADTSKRDPAYTIRALTWQLYHVSRPDVRKHLDACFASHRNGRKHPTVGTIGTIFHKIVQQSGDIWIVLDALDGCPGHDRRRDAVLEWIKHLHTGPYHIHLSGSSMPFSDSSIRRT